MIDLHERFAGLDEIGTEDLWGEIEFRFEAGAERVPYPSSRVRTRRLAIAGATAALVALFIGAAMLLSSLQEDAPPVITEVPPTTGLSAPSTSLPPTTVTEAPTTLPTVPSAGLADLLEWTLIKVPGEIEVDCSDYKRQEDPLCITPFGAVLKDVLVADDHLIAVGHDGSTGQRQGVVFISDDGENWSRTSDPNTDPGVGATDVRAITVGDDTVVAVGSRDCSLGDTAGASRVESCPLVWISSDGEIWESTGFDAIRTGDGTPFAAAISDGDFAPDTAYGLADYGIHDIAWTGSEFVAVGRAIWTSRDGRSWTMTPLPSENNPSGECSPQCRANAVLVTKEGIVAAGKDPTLQASPQGGKASMWLSRDGVTWSQIQPDLPEYSEFSEVVATSNRYVALAGAFAIATEDPSDWSDIDAVALGGEGFATGRSAIGAVVDGERIVAVGGQDPHRYLTEGGAARVWVSLNGGMAWDVYPHDDMSLFGAYHSSTAMAEMQAAVLFRGGIVVVGWYNTDAAAWIGTWTD